ncbi:hypothetical protein [Actinacidiphila epipremni]|uniref:DUF8017 domain-containing protein n=1 Tax=Actinacidiphila epipremni TaxID=2053013 RepID=A0ABX0ZY63_9ACTN|nr:hypothetical protein [Actinacidiphila epipremni]NJP46373.1 hypothetical protein [Actinacidiphila epipremni]
MWPGDQQAGGQSGGQQYPSGNTPPQQPQGPYGQPPSPYGQPGYPPQQPAYPQQGQQPPAQPPSPPGPPVQPPPYQQPTQPYGTASPYAQPGYQKPGGPGGYPTPQAFGPPVPGVPGGGGPGGRNKTTVAVAIGAALAVIAAVVVTVVFVTGDDKKTDAHDSASPSVTAATSTAAPTPSGTGTTEPPADDGGDDDGARGPAGTGQVDPVVPGWHAVKREERNSAFDVPPNWTVGSESLSIGYEDDAGKPQVVVGAPAYYMEDACKNGKNTVANATAGTKGAAGASSMKEAAENEARAWAKYAFQENGKGTVSAAQNSKAFHNAYGITGWQAQATTTAVPKANKCSSNGIAYAVAWLDPAQKTPTPVVWVLWARQGVPDQLAQSVVDRIESTIRPIKQ